VYVDHGMWDKIVLNLLSNAFKFTLDGSITVRLTAVDGEAVLSVTDTGVGIPEQELPRLFERFHRIERQKSRTHEGSGIGLALTSELVRLHGGSISARSKLAEGTTVEVRVPFGRKHLDPSRLASEEMHVASSETAVQYLAEVEATIDDVAPAVPAVAASSRRGRILLADDNRDLRNYVSRILSSVHDVVAVGNGAEALDALRRGRFDLVITDVMMPEMNGFELLEAIRSDERLRRTPVLMLSARAGEESAVEGLSRGADDYLVKPFSANELIARANAHVNAATDIRAQKEVWERTKRIAQALQEGFLPIRLPQTPRLRVDAIYQGAEADAVVGGDWYDAMSLPDGRHLLSVGDVTGHGVEASAIAGRLRYAIVDFALTGESASGILKRVNDVLNLEHPGVYAT
ncbi:MAG: response regulator, partial [Polyangiaceae bacterium]